MFQQKIKTMTTLKANGQYFGGGISFYDQKGSVICLKAFNTYVSSLSTALSIVKR